MTGAAGTEIDRKFAVFHARRQEALRIAFEEGNVGKAFKYLTDPCFLADINTQLNPKILFYDPVTGGPIADPKINFTLIVDHALTAEMGATDVLTAWKNTFENAKSTYRDYAPGAGAYVDSAGVRHGAVRFPHVDNIRVKGTSTVYNVNDPKVKGFMRDQLFALAEEIQHSIQRQPLDGAALKYKPLRDYLDYVLNSAPAAERDAFLHEFKNSGLGGLLEIDIVLDRIAMEKYYQTYSFTLQTFHRERWKAFAYFEKVARADPKWKDLFPKEWHDFCPADFMVPNPTWP
jgi:hypothetical protein